MTSKDLHELNDLGVGRPAVLAGLVLLDAQACVIAALPMNDQFNLVVDDLDDNLFDKQPDYLLRVSTLAPTPCPCLRKIATKLKKPFTLFSAQCNGG